MKQYVNHNMKQKTGLSPLKLGFNHLYSQFAYFLSQRVSIDAQKLGCLDLIASRE